MNDVIRSGGRYFFFTNGSRLWRSDGTSAGTEVVKQTAYGTFLGANAQYAYYVTGTTGRLSRTDGTDAGTIELPLTSIRCAEAAFVGDVLIVRAVMPQGVQLWRSDGTVAGTTRLATFASFEPCLFFQSDIEARGDRVYLNGYDAAHGWEPWVTDGTVTGTRMLVDLYPGRTGSEPGEFTLAEDVLFFTATTPTIGNELWAIGARAAVPKRRAAGPR
jgi:trimeric autotransporter adhesin